jgi:hypothetical protein
MMRVKTLLVVLLFLLVGVTPCAHAQLVGVPFEIFTTNGAHYDDPNVVLLMDVVNGTGIAKFKFYNNSTVDIDPLKSGCSIARVYFDDGTLLDINSIVGSSGVSFNQIYPGPGNLPGGGLLDPPFVADLEFSIGGEHAPSHKGIDNPGEWLEVTFDLINGGTLDDVIDELHTGTLRVGMHVIAFPDGSSESAIPEPATIALLGLGALALLRKRKRT